MSVKFDESAEGFTYSTNDSSGVNDKIENPETEEIYEKLFALFGVRPVDYGFGWIQKGNPSTIAFEEAMKIITEGSNYGM
jgi:hypothetical protein